MISLSNLKIAQKGVVLAVVPIVTGVLFSAVLLYVVSVVQTQVDRQLVAIIGAAVSVCVSVGLALFFTSGITRRVATVVDNSMRLARREKLQPLLSGSDEIARLDRIFHEMAATIEASAKRERAILDNALDVICSLNKNLEFVAVSPSVEKSWQYLQKEVIGRSLMEFVRPDDLQLTNMGLASARAEQESKFENGITTKSGSTVSVSWSVFWSADEQAYFCVGHDITDRKRAEELLRESESRIRLIIESMPIGLLIIDEDGFIEMTNIRTDQMFGYRYEDLLGEHISKLFGDSTPIQPEYLNQLVSKYLGKVSEVDTRRTDGSVVQVELSLNEFALHGAKKILAVMMDVSERYAVQQLKKQFVAMVSHDLRTPLTMIQNTLAILDSQTVGTLDKRGEQLVTNAENETRRLIEMINSLLDIEKMESGRMDMELHSVSLDSVISRSVTVVSHAAEKARC